MQASESSPVRDRRSTTELHRQPPFLRPFRWIPLSLWRMASMTPDLRLPSQPQSITAHWPVPIYTAWWQSVMWSEGKIKYYNNNNNITYWVHSTVALTSWSPLFVCGSSEIFVSSDSKTRVLTATELLVDTFLSGAVDFWTASRALEFLHSNLL